MPSTERHSSGRSFISLRQLLARAGRLTRTDRAGHEPSFDQLEARWHLAGNAPSFNQVFNTASPITPPAITLDGNGVGTVSNGVISPAADDDVFSFVAPADDFVRIWADTLNSSGSSLDSRIRVFTGTLGGNANPLADFNIAGRDNGTLTSGQFRDGWFGFRAAAGVRYYVNVLSDAASGPGSTGNYILRVNALSGTFPSLNTTTGVGQTSGNITLRGSDAVYRLTIPNNPSFDSLATLVATSTVAGSPLVPILDTRVDIYRGDGSPLTLPNAVPVADSDTGFLSNAFLGMKVIPGGTYFIRVRSDRLGPAPQASTGPFTLKIDAIGTPINLTPTTRFGGIPSQNLPNISDSVLNTFVAQGTGVGVITVSPFFGNLTPLLRSAIRLYDSNGTLITFNLRPDATARIEANLIGGQRYFLAIESFDGVDPGDFTIQVEANINYNPLPPGSVNANERRNDDHVDSPIPPGLAQTGALTDAQRRRFLEATPIVWGAPEDATVPLSPADPPLPTPTDHWEVVRGRASGRIFPFVGGDPRNNDTDLFMFTPPADMLSDFAGEAIPSVGTPPPPPRWNTGARPASRLQLQALGDALFEARVRIFDSSVLDPTVANPTAIWDNQQIYAGVTDPAGSLSPSVFPPTTQNFQQSYGFAYPNQANGIKVWGGEVYFLEVSFDTGNGTREGRYNLELQVDAPTDANQRFEFTDPIPGAGEFDTALQLNIGDATGDGTNRFGVAGSGTFQLDPSPTLPQYRLTGGFALGRGRAGNFTNPNMPPPPNGAGAFFDPEQFNGSPGNNGYLLLAKSDLGLISTVGQTDLYQFRAVTSGTAEIRINTTNVQDQYFEAEWRWTNPTPSAQAAPAAPTERRPSNKNYNSLLDSALTIFNNDFQRIAFNDDNTVTAGTSDTAALGTLGTYTFQRRDARTVFEIEAGKTYYVQVESGQRRAALANQLIDWRHATGSYELLIHTMPSLTLQSDDHINLNQAGNAIQATNIPIDLDLTSSSAVLGSVAGIVNNNASNLKDTDLFQFYSPSGTEADPAIARVVVKPTSVSGFNRRVTVYSLINNGFNALAQTTATGTNDAVVTFSATQGERFFVLVEGNDTNGGLASPNQGGYTLELSGVPARRSQLNEVQVRPDSTNPPAAGAALSITNVAVPNLLSWDRAARIPTDTYDYTGYARITSSIQNPGDLAIFAFDALTFNQLKVDVARTSGSNFRPAVRIYEVNDDALSQGVFDPFMPNPIFQRIGYDDALLNTTDPTSSFSASTTVPLTAPPRTASQMLSGVFNTYYVVVSGADPNIDYGGFSLTLTFNDANNTTAINGGSGTIDDHPDVNQWVIADPITIVNNPATQTGIGGIDGVVERQGDSDLFTFVAPTTGNINITISSPINSALRPQIRVFNSSFQPVQDVLTSQTVLVGPDTGISAITFRVAGSRGETYYIVAEAGPLGSVKNQPTGAYSISLSVPIPDDHPNAGEFPIAEPIVLSGFTGVGTNTGNLEVASDTDLFRFDTIEPGNVRVTLATSGMTAFKPVLALFDGSNNPVGSPVTDGGAGDEDGLVNGVVVRTISSAPQGVRYFVLVSSDAGASPRIGGYSVTVAGPRPGGPSADDHANAGDWDNATLIPLSRSDGRGQSTGVINPPLDTDLFTIVSLAGSVQRPRQALVQVLAPSGQSLNLGVRIFGPDRREIVRGTTPTPGVAASAEFTINAADQRYWIQIDGLSASAIGSYTVRVQTEPALYTLYYPEGFANNSIREYVSLGNTQPFAVNYTVRLRYELRPNETNIPDTVFTGTLQANQRGGVTLSDGPNGAAPGIRVGRGYSIIVESDAFLAANISHYDFGSTFGEAFTRTTSTTWSFARVDKFPGGINDFIIYYNPNPTPVIVTMTAYYASGAPVTISQTVQGNRRFGWNINDTPTLRLGQFSAVLTSAPAVAGQEHVGIVASLSHYDLTTAPRVGYGLLGDPRGGATRGVIPSLTEGDNAFATVTFFNNSSTATTVNLTGQYIRTTIPDLVRPVTIAPFSFVTLSGADLGLVRNQPVGIRYQSSTAVTVLAGTRQLGGVDITQGNTEAASSWFWGDAFINRNVAGTLYYETMSLYNPTDAQISITLNFFFRQGTRTAYTVNVGARSFAQVDLHRLPEVIGQYVFNVFSVEATSSSPFSAKFNHYDLVLNGGWGSRGAPLEFPIQLSSIN